jgi:hypothetical protein
MISLVVVTVSVATQMLLKKTIITTTSLLVLHVGVTMTLN